jgi:alanyl-tRNA synthetase
VRTTAEIGLFKILSESSVGAAARRIEAVTSGEAASYLFEQERQAQRLRQELEDARKEWTRRERQLRAEGASADTSVGDLLASATDAAGVRIVAAEAGEMDADALLDLSDRVKQKAAPAAVVLAARADGRVHLVANFSDDAVARGASAADVVKAAAAVVGGGGGGRPTMARAGGTNPEKIAEALAVAERALREALG